MLRFYVGPSRRTVQQGFDQSGSNHNLPQLPIYVNKKISVDITSIHLNRNMQKLSTYKYVCKSSVHALRPASVCRRRLITRPTIRSWSLSTSREESHGVESSQSRRRCSCPGCTNTFIDDNFSLLWIFLKENSQFSG